MFKCLWSKEICDSDFYLQLLYAIKILSIFKISDFLHYSERYIKASLYHAFIDVFSAVNFVYLKIINKSYANLIILLFSIMF